MKFNKVKYFSLFMFLIYPLITYSLDDIYQENYAILRNVVAGKKNQLNIFCSELEQNAKQISHDKVMKKFFKIKNHYYNLKKKSKPPADVVNQMESFKREIQNYYIEKYINFYDILFINRKGEIFYTIKKEYDYHKNIFSDEFSETSLSKTLKNHPQETFVDFSYFFPSDEPAAFFVIPAVIEGENAGWFVLQTAINKINSIFTTFDELGRTGEVFLVNKNRFMMTDSWVVKDSTILNKTLSKENILSKFKEQKGTKLVEDYRGKTVLSAFDIFKFYDSEWLIIAKKDRDEIITENYLNKIDKIENLIDFSKLQDRKELKESPCVSFKKIKKVDMDEYIKVNNNELICTFGISSCTAVTFSYPGKWAYMAHLSPYDKMYNKNKYQTNLIEEIIRNINKFEIYPYEINNIKIYVTANHLNSFKNIIKTLLNNGIFLSQIYILYNPNAKYAFFHYSYNNDSFCCEWTMKDSNNGIVKHNENLYSIDHYLNDLTLNS